MSKYFHLLPLRTQYLNKRCGKYSPSVNREREERERELNVSGFPCGNFLARVNLSQTKFCLCLQNVNYLFIMKWFIFYTLLSNKLLHSFQAKIKWGSLVSSLVLQGSYDGWLEGGGPVISPLMSDLMRTINLYQHWEVAGPRLTGWRCCWQK